MGKNKIFYSLLFILCATVCCDDIIEQNISKQTVELRAPSNGYVTTLSSQTLWWDTLAGGKQFKLTIVSPTIDSINTIILDTLVSKTQFTVKFPIGKFQWCVKSINAGYETHYSCRDIEIEN